MKTKLLVLFGALTISPIALELAHSKQVPRDDFVLECLHRDHHTNPNDTLFVYYTSSKNELVIRTTMNRYKTGNYIATLDQIKPDSNSDSIIHIYGHNNDRKSGVSHRFKIFLNKRNNLAGLIEGTFDLETQHIESGSSEYYKTCKFNGL